MLGRAYPQQGEDYQFFTCYCSFGAKTEQKAVEIQSESSESLKQQTFRIPTIVPEKQQSDPKLCFVICIRTAFPSESTNDSDNEKEGTLLFGPKLEQHGRPSGEGRTQIGGVEFCELDAKIYSAVKNFPLEPYWHATWGQGPQTSYGD